MKIVVMGGTGRIGSRLVKLLLERGCETVAASPSTGVNSITGEGLAGALDKAQAVVDVTNAPAFDDAGVMRFFETSTRNLLEAEKAAHVGHLVLLSVVGAELLQESGYMRAKVAQENLVKTAGIPFTILRATQFFEFLGAIANASTEGGTVRLPAALVQPVAAGDVAAVLADVAMDAPANGTIELAGPEQFRLSDLIRQYLSAIRDPRRVKTDSQARYFGAVLEARSLLPGENARIGPTRFSAWLEGQTD